MYSQKTAMSSAKFDAKSVLANMRASRSSIITKPILNSKDIRIQTSQPRDIADVRTSLEMLNGFVETSKRDVRTKDIAKQNLIKSVSQSRNESIGEESKAGFQDDELEFYHSIMTSGDVRGDGDEDGGDRKHTTKKKLQHKLKNKTDSEESDGSWSDFDSDEENLKFGTKKSPQIIKLEETPNKGESEIGFENQLKMMMEKDDCHDNGEPPSDDSYVEGEEDLDLGLDMKDFDSYDDLMASGGGYLSSDEEKQQEKQKPKIKSSSTSTSSRDKVVDHSEDDDDWVLREFERRLHVAKELNSEMHNDKDIDNENDNNNLPSKRTERQQQKDLVEQRKPNFSKTAPLTPSKGGFEIDFAAGDDEEGKKNFHDNDEIILRKGKKANGPPPRSSQDNFQTNYKPGQRMTVVRRGSTTSNRSSKMTPPTTKTKMTF